MGAPLEVQIKQDMFLKIIQTIKRSTYYQQDDPFRSVDLYPGMARMLKGFKTGQKKLIIARAIDHMLNCGDLVEVEGKVRGRMYAKPRRGIASKPWRTVSNQRLGIMESHGLGWHCGNG